MLVSATLFSTRPRIASSAPRHRRTTPSTTLRVEMISWPGTALRRRFRRERRALSWSADRSRVIVLVDGTTDGSEYQLVDLNTHMARPLGPAYPEIHPSDVAAVKFIHYAAADGTTIPAILTLPNGREAKNLPLIVFPTAGRLRGICRASTGGLKPWRREAMLSCNHSFAVRMALAGNMRPPDLASGGERCRPICLTACATSRGRD